MARPKNNRPNRVNGATTVSTENTQQSSNETPSEEKTDLTESQENKSPSEEQSQEETPSDESNAEQSSQDDKASEDSQNPPPEDKNTTEAVVEEEPASVIEDPKVQGLENLLQAFVKQNTIKGTAPEHFTESAKLASAITRYIIANPTIPVLDHLRQFFIDNIDGVCAPNNFMKGSTTLPHLDEQKVGFVYNLFRDLASNIRPRKNEGLIIQILGRIEILEYYGKFVR